MTVTKVVLLIVFICITTVAIISILLYIKAIRYTNEVEAKMYELMYNKKSKLNKKDSKHRKLVKAVEEAEENFYRIPSDASYCELRMAKDRLEEYKQHGGRF